MSSFAAILPKLRNSRTIYVHIQLVIVSTMSTFLPHRKNIRRYKEKSFLYRNVTRDEKSIYFKKSDLWVAVIHIYCKTESLKQKDDTRCFLEARRYGLLQIMMIRLITNATTINRFQRFVATIRTLVVVIRTLVYMQSMHPFIHPLILKKRFAARWKH